MSTTMLNAEVELSRQLGDYWAGTTTSAGSSTTLVDTALMAKANDWASDEMYDFITSATCQFEERKVSALDNTTGTCTNLAHSGTGPGISATYRLHRLFKASDKNIALVYAARHGYPYIVDDDKNEIFYDYTEAQHNEPEPLVVTILVFQMSTSEIVLPVYV